MRTGWWTTGAGLLAAPAADAVATGGALSGGYDLALALARHDGGGVAVAGAWLLPWGRTCLLLLAPALRCARTRIACAGMFQVIESSNYNVKVGGGCRTRPQSKTDNLHDTGPPLILSR